jgi:hypothetical protein
MRTRHRIRPVVGSVLDDRRAREAEEERGRQVSRVPRAAEAMTREHLLHRAEHALPPVARATPVALLVALDQRQEVLAAPEEAQENGDDLPEHLARRRVGRGRTLDLGRDALQARLERAAMEVVLRREVEIHRPLADTRARRDLAHQDLVEVALREDRGGRARIRSRLSPFRM